MFVKVLFENVIYEIQLIYIIFIVILLLHGACC